MNRLKYATIAAVTVMGLATVTHAAVFLDENFDSRTVGDSFPGSASSPGGVGWVWSFVENSATVKVAAPVGTNTTNSAELAKAAANSSPNLVTEWTQNAVTSGPLDVKFSMSATTADASNIAFIGDVWGGNMVTRLYTYNASNLIAASRDGGGNFVDVDLGAVLTANAWDNIEVVTDLDTESFQVKVNGVAAGASLPFSSGWNSTSGSPWKLQFRSEGGAAADARTFNVDNIVVTDVVPEPAAMSLIGLTGLMALSRRRRQS